MDIILSKPKRVIEKYGDAAFQVAESLFLPIALGILPTTQALVIGHQEPGFIAAFIPNGADMGRNAPSFLEHLAAGRPALSRPGLVVNGQFTGLHSIGDAPMPRSAKTAAFMRPGIALCTKDSNSAIMFT